MVYCCKMQTTQDVHSPITTSEIEHNCFKVFFPITDIATYRLNLPRGQFI